jgi:hypothetical protein
MKEWIRLEIRGGVYCIRWVRASLSLAASGLECAAAFDKIPIPEN